MVEDLSPSHTASTTPNLIEGEQRLTSLVGQFFVVPLLIAVTAVSIFVGVKMMTGEEKDPIRLVNEIRLQHGSARWQVAYDLNSRLVRDPKARQNPDLVPKLMEVYQQIGVSVDPDDVRTRTYLVTILGTLRNPVAMPVIVKGMHDPDGATQVAAIQAAGAIGDPAVLPDLVQLAQGDDAGLRKAAVFALGLYCPRRREAEKLGPIPTNDGAQALAAIHGAHNSSIEDVRWNAALALAGWGAAEATSTLKSMLDRPYLERVAANKGTSMTEEMIAEVMVNAMKGVLELNDASFRPVLDQLRSSDRSMEVRQAAGTALEALRK